MDSTRRVVGSISPGPLDKTYFHSAGSILFRLRLAELSQVKLVDVLQFLVDWTRGWLG